MAEKSRFPMVFEKCPSCGSEETITQVAWSEEAKKGRVKKDTPVAAQRLQIALIDPAKPPILSVDILLMEVDFCVCGRCYCKKAQIVQGKVGMGPPPPGGNIRGFGFPQGDPRLS